MPRVPDRLVERYDAARIDPRGVGLDREDDVALVQVVDEPELEPRHAPRSDERGLAGVARERHVPDAAVDPEPLGEREVAEHVDRDELRGRRILVGRDIDEQAGADPDRHRAAALEDLERRREPDAVGARRVLADPRVAHRRVRQRRPPVPLGRDVGDDPLGLDAAAGVVDATGDDVDPPVRAPLADVRAADADPAPGERAADRAGERAGHGWTPSVAQRASFSSAWASPSAEISSVQRRAHAIARSAVALSTTWTATS